MFKVALMTVKKRDEHRVFENLSADVTSIALGTYLLREMLDVDLLVTDEVDDIIAFDPDLVGFSSASANYGMTISAAKRVKLVCDVPIIIGDRISRHCPNHLTLSLTLQLLEKGRRRFVILSRFIWIQNMTKRTFLRLEVLHFGTGTGLLERRSVRQLATWGLSRFRIAVGGSIKLGCPI